MWSVLFSVTRFEIEVGLLSLHPIRWEATFAIYRPHVLGISQE